jgi:hypothetical protein
MAEVRISASTNELCDPLTQAVQGFESPAGPRSLGTGATLFRRGSRGLQTAALTTMEEPRRIEDDTLVESPDARCSESAVVRSV